jgi:hypothetical protein
VECQRRRGCGPGYVPTESWDLTNAVHLTSSFAGAALHGASLSRQFKTKDIRVTDITPYDIQVSYNSEARPDASRARTINTLVFPSGSKHGSKKTLTFKRKDDFVLKLAYKSAPAPYVVLSAMVCDLG